MHRLLHCAGWLRLAAEKRQPDLPGSRGVVRDHASGKNLVSLPSVKIPSHGLFADNLAIAAGGGANAVQLRNALAAAKAAGDKGFLIIGSNGALDLAVISNAVDSQDLSGMTIFYTGDPAKGDAIGSAVKRAKSEFLLVR